MVASARYEQATYNGYVIGGAAGPPILDRFGFSEDESNAGCQSEFVVRFRITGTGANPNAILADLAAKCNAAEAALRVPRQLLSVVFGTATQLTFDPLVTDGLQPPLTAPVLSQAGAAGVVTAGQHVAWVTYTTAAGESVVGPASNVVNFAGGYQATVASISLGPAGTTARTVYFSQALGWTPYLAVVIADNSTTTSTFNLADASLVTTSPVETIMGFDQAPKLRKLEGPESTGPSRGYEFRVAIGLPPLLAGQQGRRTSEWQFHYDVTDRPVIKGTGSWTQMPGFLSRNQFLAQVDAFAAQRIALISPGTTWALTLRDEPESDSQATMTFSREYSQHINGRRGSVNDIKYLPSGLRLVMSTGTYLRTVVPNQAASVNFGDAVTGGIAFAISELAAFTTAEGGPLIVDPSSSSSNCEMLGFSAKPNEQDDRCDYAIGFRELLFKQSSSAIGLDDPDIFLDSVIFAVSPVPADDSPMPPPQTPPPLGVGGGPSAASASSVFANSGGGSTTPGGGAGPGAAVASGMAASSSGTSSSATATSAQRPTDVFIEYRATFKKGVNLVDKWNNILLPYLLDEFTSMIGLGPTILVRARPAYDFTASTIAVTVQGKAFVGDVFAFKVTYLFTDVLGLRASGAFTGIADQYLIQQALPNSTCRRTISATFRTGGAFSIANFLTVSQIPGWLVLDRSRPVEFDVDGIPGLSLGQIGLTNSSLSEDMLYVNLAVAGSTFNIPNGAATAPAPNGRAAASPAAAAMAANNG